MNPSLCRFFLASVFLLQPAISGAAVAQAADAPAQISAPVAAPSAAVVPVAASENMSAGLPLKMLARNAWPMKAREALDVIINIWTDAGPITADMLKPVNGHKVDLYLLSPDFKQFYHLTPSATPEPGEYRASFIPRLKTGMRAWVEFTTNEGHKVAMADVNEEKLTVNPLSSRQLVQATVGNLKFSIDFSDEILVNKTLIGTLIASEIDTYLPFRKLERMGQDFTHVVAFGGDYKSFFRVQPIVDIRDPSQAYGGPSVRYQITPTVPGMMAVFAEFRVGGKPILAPFTVNVQAQSKRIRSRDLENRSRPEQLDPPE